MGRFDPSFRGAGPPRLLALLYQKAPPFPIGPELAGEEDVIEELFREAIELAPDHVENYVCYAEFLKEEDRKVEALNTARKARKLLSGKRLTRGERRALTVRIQQLLEALRP